MLEIVLEVEITVRRKKMLKNKEIEIIAKVVILFWENSFDAHPLNYHIYIGENIAVEKILEKA